MNASYHISPRKEFFNTYRKVNLGMVKMGSMTKSKILRIGDVVVQTSLGVILTLRVVHYVMDIWHNLISMNVLDHEDYDQSFTD